MKRIFLSIALLACIVGSGQNVKKTSDGNYVAVTTEKSREPGKLTGKTYTDSKWNKFPVYVSGTGKLYVIRKSGKTGKEYKQYLKLS